jgi:hypothetical protein
MIAELKGDVGGKREDGCVKTLISYTRGIYDFASKAVKIVMDVFLIKALKNKRLH